MSAGCTSARWREAIARQDSEAHCGLIEAGPELCMLAKALEGFNSKVDEQLDVCFLGPATLGIEPSWVHKVVNRDTGLHLMLLLHTSEPLLMLQCDVTMSEVQCRSCAIYMVMHLHG